MKTDSEYKKEINLLLEQRSNKKAMDDLAKLKLGIRPKFDYAFISFWKNNNDSEILNVELNKKESEILRRFLYELKRRGLK